MLVELNYLFMPPTTLLGPPLSPFFLSNNLKLILLPLPYFIYNQPEKNHDFFSYV